MLEDLEPAVRDAVMNVLSAIYESGTVETVNLRDVYSLFGVTPQSPENETEYVDFKSTGWAEDYMRFTHNISDDTEVLAVRVEADGSLPPEVQAQLESIGLSPEDLEEIQEAIAQAEELPEDVSPEDLSTDRIIH